MEGQWATCRKLEDKNDERAVHEMEAWFTTSQREVKSLLSEE